VPRLRRRIVIMLAVALLSAAATVWHGALRPAAPAQALPLGPGWNLIADPGGLVATGPAYTLQLNDTSYETVPAGGPLVAGLGYWVASSNGQAVPLAAGLPRATIHAPAGQWVMVGNPTGIYPAHVSGADYLYTYDPQLGYQEVDDATLDPGQGAFALSKQGSDISLIALGPAPVPPCSLADNGSACAVNGACPAGYPVAITQDGLAHQQPQQGDPAVQGTIVICFNDISQAIGAGYVLAPQTRIIINGPATAETSNMRVTVLRALLESPDAFLARTLVSADQLCSACNISGANAIVTVEYGVENFNRPATLVTTGRFISEHQPTETSPAYFMLASQQPIDPVHNGVPTAGSISGVFGHAHFGDINRIDWRLDDPFIDNITSIPQPHGPNLAFELDFRGPQAGQIIGYGAGSAPLPAYDPGTIGGPPATGYGTLITVGNPPPTSTPGPTAPSPTPVSQPSGSTSPSGGSSTYPGLSPLVNQPFTR
jgi:hypothetical protein